MNNKFLELVLSWFKPTINAEIETVCTELEASKTELETQLAAGGTAVIPLVNAKLKELTAKSPLLSMAESAVQPEIDGFLSGLEAEGESEIGPAIDKVVAFLKREEAVI